MIWTAQRCRCHAEWWLLLPNGALPEFFGCFTAYIAVRQTKNSLSLPRTGRVDRDREQEERDEALSPETERARQLAALSSRASRRGG